MRRFPSYTSFPVGVVAVLTLASTMLSVRQHAQQAAPARQTVSAPQQPTARPSYEAPAELQHTDLPLWPYTPTPPADAPKPPPDNGEPHHLPGSSKAFTQKEIDGLSAVDWFPDSHPKAPKAVIDGQPGVYRACGTCHLINGYGKSDTQNLNGMPVAYMRQQLDDMRGDLRHASVVNMGVITMIPVAKNVPDEDATAALEYFHSIGPAKWLRVVETTTVPKTMPAAHRLTAIDPSGAMEPIGNRIIELPESFERTERRDPTSGFLAYVPVGSLKKGEALVKTTCVVCHGANLHGMGDTIPPIAGRSPSATGRQLYDFKTGARHGKNSAMMKPVVEKLSDADIVNISAYLASLPQ